MQELVAQLLNNRLSRRGFFRRMLAAGFTAAAVDEILSNLEAAQASSPAADDAFRTVTANGSELWVEQLRASGVEYVFSNPGSVEVGFFDALVEAPELQMILGLHEGVVIAMADGYHKTSGKPAFVNVHAMPGTAQIAGQLLNAHMAHSAIVVTAGLNDNTVFSDHPDLGPSPGTAQADIAKPFTKIAWDVRQPESIPSALRRAFKVASTPPGGPVYVGVARYAQSGDRVTAQIVDQAKYVVPMRPRPDKEKIEQVARQLIEGRQPLFVADHALQRSGGVEQAVELVDLLGIPVMDPRGSISTNNGFPNQHPLYWDGWIFGTLESRPPKIPYERYDVIVGLGYENVASAQPTGNRAPAEIRLAPHAWTAVIGVDVGTMGRTAPFDLGIVADPRAAMIDLLEAVKSLATKARLTKIKEERFSRAAPQIAAVRRQVEQNVKAVFGRQPMHPSELAMAIEDAIDRDAITINENLSHDFSLHHGLIQRFGGDAKLRLSAGGGSLGWGVGAAIGAKIGEPNRQVVAHIGDGSLMYSAAGFWTMARYDVPVLIIVWNNRNYQTVRHGFSRFGGNMARSGRYPGLHLGDPDIDFVGLAKSQGVEGERTTTASELRDALERGVGATRAGSPYVIDAAIGQFGGGADSEWYQEFSLAERRTRAV